MGSSSTQTSPQFPTASSGDSCPGLGVSLAQPRELSFLGRNGLGLVIRQGLLLAQAEDEPEPLNRKAQTWKDDSAAIDGRNLRWCTKDRSSSASTLTNQQTCTVYDCMTKEWWTPWYRREKGAAGRWRYVIDGRPVPGGRDLRLMHLVRPFRRSGFVELPLEVVRGWPEFAWARGSTLKGAPSPLTAGGVVVELEEWELQRDKLVGISAPELNVAMMLTPSQLAALLGVRPKTVTAYVARGEVIPGPTWNRDRRPLWSVPVLAKHMAAARRERAERDRAIEARRRSVDRLATSEGLDLAAIDRLLSQLGADDDLDEDW